MKIKKLINCFIPVSVCNLECMYCYIPQVEGRKKNKMPQWRLSPEQIRKALSIKRLGGPCFMNLCGDGETLLPKEVPSIIEALLKEGHILEVVTNGTISERFEEIFTFDKELLSRLEFKFSYHYLQLKEKGLEDIFWKNVRRSRECGISITVEITPHDELIPYIDEIKRHCIENVGALCHVTTAFNYKENFKLLTKLSQEEYIKIWSQFDSPMFNFKMSVLGVKRDEYCYAGDYLISVDLASGLAHQCYSGISQNIYDDVTKPIKWNAVGKRCEYNMCFNAHALLVFGAIPNFATDIHYADIRNRVTCSGEEWLSPTVKEAFMSKLCETNEEYGFIRKMYNEVECLQRRLLNHLNVKCS